MATGCVKILKKGTDFDPITGKFVPEEKRAPTVELFKGEVCEAARGLLELLSYYPAAQFLQACSRKSFFLIEDNLKGCYLVRNRIN